MPVNIVTFTDGNVLYAANLNNSFASAVSIAGDNINGNLSIKGIDILSGMQNSYNEANAAFIKANSAATTAQAAFNAANSGPALGQFAYNQANSAINVASFAYSQANAAFTQANAAFNAANTNNSGSANTIILQGIEITQNNSISAVNTYSISSYSEANAAFILANAAFAQANLASGNTGTALAQGAFAESNSFQSVINSAFTVANTSSANTIILQGIEITQNNSISAVNTYSISAYSTANSALIQVIAAYAEANVISANTIYTQGVDITQNTSITSITNLVQSAFNKANNTGFALLSANGNSLQTATTLTANVNFITAVNVGTGVAISTPIGTIQYVVNRGANTLNVFPISTAQIENLGVNTPLQMANNYSIGFYPVAANLIYMITGGP